MDPGSSRWGGKRAWQIAAGVAAAVALGAVIALVVVGCGSDPPEADFSAAPTSGEVPFEVAFTDASSGDPESWSWDFGDGGASTDQNPTHVYEQPGTYRVILTVRNGDGSDDVVKPDLVIATNPPLNQFCQSVVDLRDAAERLIAPDTLVGGVESIRAALADVQAALAEVRASGTDEYADQIDRVENAVAAVSGLIDSIQEGAGAQEILAQAGTAALEVVAAVNALRDAVQQGCEPA
jgi:PKD repeat protein